MALPYAFSLTGIPLGMALLTTLTAIIYSNMLTLVELKRRHARGRCFTYGDVGEAILGPTGRYLVEISLAAMELGICTVYFSYISTNLAAALGHNSTVEQRRLMLLLFPILAAFGLVTQIKYVAWLSSAANLLMATALGIVWYYLSAYIHTNGIQHDQLSGPTAGDQEMLLTVATIIYSFEGCGAVLPIENALKTPSSFRSVCTAAFVTFFFVYTLMGTLGALSFNYHVDGLTRDDRGSISAVIAFYYESGSDKTVGQCLNALLGLAVAMTYPIQFFAAIQIFEGHLGLGGNGWSVQQGGWSKVAYRALLRLGLVATTLMLAYAIPKLSLIIALFGALFGGMIELVLPPLLYVCDSAGGSQAYKAWNIALLIVGGAAVLGGASQAIIGIVG